MDLYPQGDTKPLVFSAPYDYISNISYSFHPHFRIGKVLQWFEKKIHGLLHHFVAIQGNDCVFSLDPNLSLSSSFSLYSNDYEYDLEEIL